MPLPVHRGFFHRSGGFGIYRPGHSGAGCRPNERCEDTSVGCALFDWSAAGHCESRAFWNAAARSPTAGHCVSRH